MNKKTLLILIGSLFLPFSLLAETYTYQAISDFPDITAGEVPFYKDTVANRNVLAINAANENYRDKFARATRTFDGDSGTYDVTIVALGEIDGECIYRLSVNDTIIGIKENVRTENDYGEQEHVFKNVVIPAGATLSVDASAVTNGLIPENGGFAYARGRWRSVLISTAGEVSDDIDLSLSIDATPTNANIGDTINYSMTVSNLSTDHTASGLSISLALPAELSFGASANCSVSNTEVSCQLPELAPKTANSVTWSAKAISAGTATINATTSADQGDNDSANNSASFDTTISGANIAKDAELSLALSNDTLKTDESSDLSITIANKGMDDLAAVIVELSAESDLDFSKPLPSCVQDTDKMLCTIDSLLADQSLSLTSSVSSAVAGTYTVEANVLVAADEVSGNNKATIMLDVEAVATTTTTEAEKEFDSGNSGSGSLAILMLSVLSLLGFRQRVA